MLDRIFISMLNMSLISSYVIVFVLLTRLLLKKAPKIFSYALWAVVLVRLLCPISLESAVGLLPHNMEPIPQNIGLQEIPQIETDIPLLNEVVNEVLPPVTNHATSVNPLQIWIFIGRCIWIIGMVVLLLYSGISFLLLRRKLVGAVPFRKGIYLSDYIEMPFVMGVIKPRIYIPSSLSKTERAVVICHENVHIQRGDHITRILAFLALVMHWFNPLVWIAFTLSSKDMELSCDEAVMKQMGWDVRLEYSQLLLQFASGNPSILTTPLAFGEGDTKGRVKNVMKYKRPMIWVSVTLLLIIAILMLVFGTSGSSDTGENSKASGTNGTNGSNESQVVELESDDTAESEVPAGDGQEETSDSELLEAAIHQAILEREDTSRYDFVCESHSVLMTEAKSPANDSEAIEQVTVYTFVLVLGFDIEGQRFTEEGGSYIPTVFTFDVTEEKEYVLQEFWQPRDGTDYTSDLKAKFPKDEQQLAFSDQNYIYANTSNCYNQVIAYGNIDTNQMIADLIAETAVMEDHESNWRRQANERDLTYFGDYFLTYAYGEFLKGNQVGEAGKIMEKACRVLLNYSGEDMDMVAETGQEWFDAYYKSVKAMEEKNGIDYVEEHLPKGFILLNMKR